MLLSFWWHVLLFLYFYWLWKCFIYLCSQFTWILQSSLLKQLLWFSLQFYFQQNQQLLLLFFYRPFQNDIEILTVSIADFFVLSRSFSILTAQTFNHVFRKWYHSLWHDFDLSFQLNILSSISTSTEFWSVNHTLM